MTTEQIAEAIKEACKDHIWQEYDSDCRQEFEIYGTTAHIDWGISLSAYLDIAEDYNGGGKIVTYLQSAVCDIDEITLLDSETGEELSDQPLYDMLNREWRFRYY